MWLQVIVNPSVYLDVGLILNTTCQAPYSALLYLPTIHLLFSQLQSSTVYRIFWRDLSGNSANMNIIE